LSRPEGPEKRIETGLNILAGYQRYISGIFDLYPGLMWQFMD